MGDDHTRPFSKRDPAVWSELSADAKADALDEALTSLWDQLKAAQEQLVQNSNEIKTLEDVIAGGEATADALTDEVEKLLHPK